jgi:GNAT superfamily N-acetyltransferase
VTPPRAAAPERPAPARRRRGPAAVVIRPAAAGDLVAVEALVASIAAEVYGHLLHGAPPRPDGDWAQALLAEIDGRVVGAMVAADDWIEDLWVAADCRRDGIGRRLLSAGEAQIAAQGHALGHLRVVAETRGARRFYERCGWSEAEAYPHEKWGVEMVDMVKQLAGSGP